MGLRINQNVTSLSVLRALALHGRDLSKVTEQLATGKRINHGKDNPAGIVQANLLRAQISELQNASEAVSFGINLLDAADDAFQQMSTSLTTIRTQIVAAQNQTDVSAEQATIDQAIDAIGALGGATTFNGLNLLNGSSSLSVTAFTAGQITDTRVYRMAFDSNTPSRTFTVTVSTKAARAGVNQAGAGLVEQGVNVADNSAGLLTINGVPPNSSTLNITGPTGSASVTTDASATSAELITLVNGVRSQTGVYAVASGANAQFITDTYGSAQQITLTNAAGGAFAFTNGGQTSTIAAGQSTANKGRDAVGTIDNVAFSASGLIARVSSPNIVASIQLAANFNTTTATTFTVNNGGVKLQAGTGAGTGNVVQVGFPSFLSGSLGSFSDVIPAPVPGSAPLSVTTGFLSTLKSGGTNALTINSPLGTQLRVVDAAIADLNRAQSIYASLSANQLQPTQDLLDNLVVEHTNQLSAVEDLDFGEATARQSVVSSLVDASIAALTSANQNPSRVLLLLGISG